MTFALQTGKTVAHCCSRIKYTVCISAEVNVDTQHKCLGQTVSLTHSSKFGGTRNTELEKDPNKPRVRACDALSLEFHMLIVAC